MTLAQLLAPLSIQALFGEHTGPYEQHHSDDNSQSERHNNNDSSQSERHNRDHTVSLRRYSHQHAVLLRGEHERFNGWLSLAKLSRYACDKTLLSHLDVLSGGLAQRCHSPPCDDPEALLDTLAQRGDSLRFRRIQCVDEPLRSLALDAMQVLGEEININVYLSPGQAPYGLAPHRDPYEVLVIQLSGQKRWRLLGPEQGEAVAWTSAGAGEPAHGNSGELICSQGDVLYLPAYVRHQVTTQGDAPSLHLALGVMRQTKRSLLEWLRSSLEDPSSGEPLTFSQLDSAIQELSRKSHSTLNQPHAAQRYLDHRRAVCYERTLASPEPYAAGSQRGYR